jgi:hypothetical protein
MFTYRGWLTIGALIVGGVLAMAGFIVSKKPDAKPLLDKLAPYQGMIGVFCLFYGVWDLITFLGNRAAMSMMLKFPGIPGSIKIFFYTFYFVWLVEMLLGFLLGYGLIASKMGGKNPDMAAKGEAMQKKLAGIQVPLGVISILIGLYWLYIGLAGPSMH